MSETSTPVKNNMETDEEFSFVFSSPSIVEDSFQSSFPVEKSNFSVLSRPNIFTFSPPSNISRNAIKPLDNSQEYSQKSRSIFHAPVNVFAKALSESGNIKQEAESPHIKSPTSLKCFINNCITCTNVPRNLLTKSAAKQHFLIYGAVAKITIRPKRHTIIVYFSTKSEAINAFNNAGKVEGKEFDIQWTSSLNASQKIQAKKKEIKRRSSRPSSSSIDDEDVRNELDNLIDLQNCLYTKFPAKKTKAVKDVKEKKGDKGNVESLKETIPMDELLKIVKSQALNSEEKYRVLDARDKLMKLHQVKNVNLEMYSVTVGTCPDMCPEKERHMRESQRQVSLYEQMEGTEYRINHKIAVKQYSRSSADQEEPMAHELRPVRSLKMTMSYLLHEVVDLCEKPDTNLAEWYNFLWDRTRGIRKDITQQELCCPETVELVEQCARFHIVCSERLCAEESSVFDKKINTENLTKCLQTLKYMYSDLRLKGVSCKNEPEFRAYVILLNLNDGNFMWELQELPENIKKSPEVKFAIKVYSAIAGNNYCRFFKLVRSTTYLNAAILLRYFNQVRVKALSIMMKAYCRTTSTNFDLYELIDILGFEDENDAIYFCEQIGLDVIQDAQEAVQIVFNRQKFQLPKSNLEQTRSLNIIDSKRTIKNISIGECISGGKLPDATYVGHVPHTSFDENGHLLPESLYALDQTLESYDSIDQEYSEDKEIDSSAESATYSPPKKNIPNFSFLEQSPTVKERNSLKSKNPFMFKEKMESQKNPTFGFNFVNEIKGFNEKYDSKKEKNTVNIFNSALTNKGIFSGYNPLTQNTFQIPKPIDAVKQPEFKMKQPTEITKSLPKAEEKSKEQLQKEEEYKKLKEEKILKEKKRKKEECEKLLAEIEKDSMKLCDELNLEVVEEICKSVVQNEIDHIRNLNSLSQELYEEMLMEIETEVCKTDLEYEIQVLRTLNELNNRMKQRRYFSIWRKQVQKRRTQNEILKDTPIWIQKRSLEECAREFYNPEQDVVLRNMRNNKRFKLMEEKPAPKLIPAEILAYTAFKESVKNSRYKRTPNIFWKCVMSWPEKKKDINSRRHKYYITKYLNSDNQSEDSFVKILKPNPFEVFYMSVQCSEGLIQDKSSTGMDGLIFVLSEMEEPEDAERRLSRIFYSIRKSMPVPVFIIVMGEDRRRGESISLENFIQAGFISKVMVICDPNVNEEKTVKILHIAIPWLVINKSTMPQLEMNYPKKILSDSLMEILWLRIQGHSMYNSQLTDIFSNPNFIIQLHNEAVNHLINILLDPDTLTCPDFAEEFKQFLRPDQELPCNYEYFNNEWRDHNYRANLEKKLRNLILPRWKFPWPSDNTKDLTNAIQFYIKEALPEVNYHVVAGTILSNWYLIMENEIKPSFTYFLSYVIEHKISNFGAELKAVYNKEHLRNFQSSPWWLKSKIYLTYVQETQSLPAIEYPLMEQNYEISQQLDNTNNSNLIYDISDLTELYDPSESCMDDEEDIHKVYSISEELSTKCEQLHSRFKSLGERMRKALEM